MQVEAQEFIGLAAEAKRIYVWDIESTNLNCDYGSILCVHVRVLGPNGKTARAEEFMVKQAGNDQKLVKDVRECLAEAAMWVTYYGKGFDVPMMEGRLLKWGQKGLTKKPHADMYFQLAHKINPSRRSQAHLADWLGLPEKKMSVSADEWVQILYKTKDVLTSTMLPRCASDTLCLSQLFWKAKHSIKEVTR